MLRRIPYGETDFVTIRKENSYYVDKTAFIPYFENAAKYIMFLRPRRFGKTLFINTLAAYYDVLEKDNFDQTFGGLYIHEHATGQQGKYMILKFSFASVDSRRENVEDSFNFTVCETIKRFIKRYKNYLPENAAEYMSDVKDVSNKALSKLLTLTSDSPYKIYIMIDEYDNFANTLFSSDEDAYKVLTHGDGFFRLFFNVLKDMTSENNALIGRIFISGVSPLTLSDVTSGFNIALNLSIDANLNDAMGFAESDVREMLEYYQNETGVFKHSIDQLVEIMKPN
ncbi:MAG: AAA family ATPase, partial [Bacteroidales bacterium]|nr:AAA family ATPase [Bacteroidales bacterium]